MSKKTKTMTTMKFTAAITTLLTALCVYAGVQISTMKKEDVPNYTNILVGVQFSEDDPVFTNWVGSTEYKQIPRMESLKYHTEYEPGKTNEGNRTKFYIGNRSDAGEITKDILVLDVYDVHDRLVIKVPDSEVSTYKCSAVEKALSNKCDKVDLTHISPLTPSATTEEIVTAVKALATALGKAE